MSASANTRTTSNGKTLYRVVIAGVDYGFMSSRARRELLARQAAS